jgi:hypothetical protein
VLDEVINYERSLSQNSPKYCTTIWKVRCRYEMFYIYQPPNAHVWISGILLSNAMAAAAVKNIYKMP